MEQEILDIYQQYPWASEITADQIAGSIASGPDSRRKIAMSITSAISPAALKHMSDELNKQKRSEKKESQAKKDLANAMAGTQRAIMVQNVDGLGAMTGLFEQLATAASELGVGNAVGGAFGSLTGSKNKIIKGIGNIGSGVADVASSTIGMAAGVATFVATFINSQDKLLKTMIDVGLADANMELLTGLRRDAASLGMGFDEYAKVLQVSSNLIGAGHDSAIQGATIFGELANTVARDDSINKFGYRTSELTLKLATTADALYRSNQINSLDAKAQQKIIDLFTTTNEIALGLASTTGENRMKLLDELEQQRQDVALNTSFAIAQNDYAEKIGPEAFENLKNSSVMYLATLASRFGKDSPMYQEIEKTMKGAIYDINYDQNIINNMTPELVQLFNEVGGGALQEFIRQGNELLAGNTTQEGAVMDTSRLLAIFSDQFDAGIRRFASVDPITNAAAAAMSAARVANEAAKDLDMEQIQKSIEETNNAIPEASKAIKAIDDTAIALTTTLEAILPGIDTMDETLDLVYGAMNFTENLITALGKIMGIDVGSGQRKVADIRKQIEDALIKDVVIYEQGSSEYNAASPLMRKSPEGDITALSYQNFITTTRDFLSDNAIGTADTNTLTERVDVLNEMKTKVADLLQNRNTGPGGARRRNPLTQEEIALYNQQLRILDEQINKVNTRLTEQEETVLDP